MPSGLWLCMDVYSSFKTEKTKFEKIKSFIKTRWKMLFSNQDFEPKIKQLNSDVIMSSSPS